MQLEFAAKSKTVHAIMFINQIRSCMNHICATEREADVKINAKPMSRHCEADVKVNAKPMSGLMRSRCHDNAKPMSRRMRSRCQDECEADVKATAKPMSRRHAHAQTPNESTHAHKQIDAKWKHAVRYVSSMFALITCPPSISLAQYSITP